MCLFITTPKGTYPKAKKAETDIVCYKIVKVAKGRKGEEIIASPFMDSKTIAWNLGEVKKASRLIRPRPSPLFQELGSTVYGVGAGYLHSYKDLETANTSLRSFVNNFAKQYKLYKAVIPEGTVYYEGDHRNIHQYEGYASRKLKLIEEM